MKNKNGGLFAYTHFTNKVIGVVGLSCETDFAEKTEAFRKIGNDLAMLVASCEVETVEDFLKEESLYESITVKNIISDLEKQLKEKVEIVKLEKITF